MSYSDAITFYRQSALGSTTPIGLVITLYDRLAADLGTATAALSDGDIEARCRALHHASLILGQLQDWVNTSSDDPLAQSLLDFYQVLRAGMLEASLRASAEVLEEQIDLVLIVRDAWQQREDRSTGASLAMQEQLQRTGTGAYAA